MATRDKNSTTADRDSASVRAHLGRSLYIRDALDGRAPSWLRIAKGAIKLLDREEREARKAEERWARFTKKGNRRPVEAVEKGKATAKRQRQQRSAKLSSARRLAQKAEHGAQLCPRELSAVAIVLSALEPGRWYLRSQIREACPELPGGSLSALLGRRLLHYPALLERALNPLRDEFRGGLRPKDVDTSPERRSRWRYRLTAAGEAARAEILTDPTKWSATARLQAGLQNARAVPQPHGREAWPQLYGRSALSASS